MPEALPIELVNVMVTPETRAFDTEYSRGPLTPGLTVDVTVRNVSEQLTFFVVTDRVAVDYESGTRTLIAKFEPPATRSHHHLFMPSSEPVKPGETKQLTGWIPLQGAEFFAASRRVENVDATNWQHLLVIVSCGRVPLRPAGAGQVPSEWIGVEKQWRRDGLSVDQASKEESA
jgi:hypothetical protein